MLGGKLARYWINLLRGYIFRKAINPVSFNFFNETVSLGIVAKNREFMRGVRVFKTH